MEYGCELWNGCGVDLSDKLEKLQLQAARIVTGLPSYASRDSLYMETGWEKLIDRRNKRVLSLMYKIVNNCAPSYLIDILPPKVSETTIYPLRNGEDLTIPNFRLTLTNRSFFRSGIRAWNSLPLATRNIPSLNSFKNVLLTPDSSSCVPRWYFTGQRKLNIIHTKLRHNNSLLNYDLFRFNLRDNPCCSCGFACENSFHYFLECPIYIQQRHHLFVILQIYGVIDLDVILYGNENLSVEQNIDIFDAVHDYIRLSKRFD